MALNALHDREWLARLGRGDEAAWVELYRAYQGRIYRFAWQMCGRASVAEEVTQATFVAFLQNYQRFDPDRGVLIAWLFGIARRQVLRHLRVGRGEVELVEIGTSACTESWDENDLDGLRRIVLNLPEPFRAVIVLCDLQELSYEEAGKVMDCPVGTIRSRLSRARQMLAERMKRVTVKPV